MSTRWARLARGLAAACFATFVAAFSHSVASGEIANPISLVLSFALSLLVCVMLTGTSLSLVRLSIAVSVSQALFHTLFSAAGAPATGASATSATITISDAGGAMHHTGAIVASGPLAHHDAWMWGAHGFAALLTIVALRFGESAYWRLIHTARLHLTALVTLAIPVTFEHDDATERVADRFFVPRKTAVLLSSMRYRGPPRSIAFA